MTILPPFPSSLIMSIEQEQQERRDRERREREGGGRRGY
jgi:hypothetical protein